MKKAEANFPQYADWIKKYCQDNPHPLIKDSGKMIAYCFDLYRKIPDKYGWRYSNQKALERQTRSAKSSKELNQIFWTDQARNVEAYSVITFWRGVELFNSAIKSLNLHEIIPPAVLARSLLELAAVFIINANTLEKNFRQLIFPKNAVVVSHELEEKIVKMIWGTRFGTPEEHLKQVNILTYLKKLTKNPNAKELMPTYEFLCDIAHPSYIGNTRYWSHIDFVYEDGSERRIISKYADNEPTKQILDKILWSLGWTAVCLRNGFEITRHALAHIIEKIEKG